MRVVVVVVGAGVDVAVDWQPELVMMRWMNWMIQKVGLRIRKMMMKNCEQLNWTCCYYLCLLLNYLTVVVVFSCSLSIISYS